MPPSPTLPSGHWVRGPVAGTQTSFLSTVPTPQVSCFPHAAAAAARAKPIRAQAKRFMDALLASELNRVIVEVDVDGYVAAGCGRRRADLEDGRRGQIERQH